MERLVHFARLERPTDPFRVVCGCWRARGNWTAVVTLVTCPECLLYLDPTRGAGDGQPKHARQRA